MVGFAMNGKEALYFSCLKIIDGNQIVQSYINLASQFLIRIENAFFGSMGLSECEI